MANGSDDDEASAAVGEVTSVRNQVAKLVETIHKNSTQSNSDEDKEKKKNHDDDAYVNNNDVVNNTGDDVTGFPGGAQSGPLLLCACEEDCDASVGNCYCCCSDQAIAEYAVGTALPLLDGVIHR
jgi:hypothetical protein